MIIDYTKLWKLLIDRKLKKKDLAKVAGLSKSTITKLSTNQNVNTGVLLKICVALNCDLADIAEVTNADKEMEHE
ncbi:MAG: helix-turn-helix transcriptional regulator [Eubacteriales bacterium]|nr:helix-turn-helix transcriptional regulator [Eubacteriales bacterium]